MKTREKCLLLTNTLLLLTICLFTPVASGQESNLTSLLNQRVESITVTKSNLNRVLADLAAHNKIPLAVEISSGKHEKRSSPQLHIESGTVRDLLEGIAAYNPEYQITVEQEIVRVSYKDKLQSDQFLDIRVNEFKVEKKDAEDIKQAIARLPEVRSTLSAQGLEVRSPVSRLGVGPYPSASLSLNNVTVREILDSLIKTQNFKYWGIRRWGENNRYIRIVLW